MYSIYADGVCIYNDVFSLDDMKLLLCNYPDAGSGASFVTRPYEARVYLYE